MDIFPTCLIAVLLGATPGCSGLRHPTAQEGESRAVRPPAAWTSAISFAPAESARIEFFDGTRTRVVTSADVMPHSDSIFGRTPWYRIETRDRLATTLHVRVAFPGSGVTTAEYPITIQRDAFYGVYIGRLDYDPRVSIIGAAQPRSYPLPPAIQRNPADSLWIYWGARGRDCWDCPS